MNIWTKAQLVSYNANRKVEGDILSKNIVLNFVNTDVTASITSRYANDAGYAGALISSSNHYAENRGGCGEQSNSMTVNIDKDSSINFTTSYATGIQVVIVTEDSAITTVDDLFAEGASHAIGVQRGTTGDLYSTWDLEEAGLATVDRYSKGAEAVQALLTGKVDCVVIDNEPAKNFVAANEGLKILDTEYITEEYAIALAKGSEMTATIDAALAELIADGTLKTIVDKYITAE
jgi:ABC-type amino acid transport substrate-binding protein